MRSNKQIIWSSDVDFDDWRDDLEAEYPNKSEKELVEIMYDRNAEYFDDEKYNLDISVGRPILVIADLGLWQGRRSGYKILSSGNINECLSCGEDYNTYYVDEMGDLRCDAVHHDGTNYLLFRVYKKTASEAQIDRLLRKIYNGTCTRQDITSATQRLGDAIANVFGWKIPGRKVNVF